MSQRLQPQLKLENNFASFSRRARPHNSNSNILEALKLHNVLACSSPLSFTMFPPWGRCVVTIDAQSTNTKRRAITKISIFNLTSIILIAQLSILMSQGSEFHLTLRFSLDQLFHCSKLHHNSSVININNTKRHEVRCSTNNWKLQITRDALQRHV